MGTYTELYICCEISNQAPEKVYEVLNYLFNRNKNPVEPPEHPFFTKERWSLIGSGSSYSFCPFAVSSFKFDEITKTFYLTSRSELKNYDNEIQEFVEWLKPYIVGYVGQHIGHIKFESSDEIDIIYI